MKIAFVYDTIHPYVAGGVQKRVWELAWRMAQRGHSVTIFGMKYWDGDDIFFKEGVRLWGVCKPQPLFDGDRRSIKQALFFALKVAGPLNKERFDIIDCQEFPYFSCFTSRIICFLKQQLLVITWHEFWGTYWYEYLGRLKGSIGRLVERIAITLPDKIIPVSERVKSQLIAAGANEKKLRVVLNGVDVDGIVHMAAAAEICDVIYAGRLAEHKNVDILIRAINLLRGKIPAVNCVIIGEGPDRSKLEHLTSQLNLAANIKFLGFLKEDADVMARIKSSKIFVLPSTREGFGMAIVEANACGVPVITVNAESNAGTDLIVEGQNGYILELSEQAIADKLCDYLTDTKIQNFMHEQALKVAAQYNWSKLSTDLENAYMEVLGNQR